MSFWYSLDPLLAMFGRTEIRPFVIRRVREAYALKLLRGRGIWVAFLSLVSAVAITMIFWAVPGHRLVH